MDTPLVNAYRKFLLNWKPEEQTENQELLRLQKDYAKSGYVFCLTGRPGHYLQDEPVFAKKWNMYYEKQKAEAKDAYFQAVAEAYYDCKKAARKTFSKKKNPQ